MVGPNYFDYAAATPLDPRALTVMVPYLGDNFYNPSAGYLASKSVAKELKQARSSIATVFGCKPVEVIFTAGGTEANNLAIDGIMQQFPGCNIVTSSIEHDSVIEPASKYSHTTIKSDQLGYIDLADLEAQINDKTVLVSVMYANNEIGTIQPINEISGLVSEVRANRLKSSNKLPIFLHTDASQAGNYLSLKINSLGVDMMTVNGGKIYGPKQSGVLYLRAGIELMPIIMGGGQEKGLRSGSENVAACIGLAKALELATKMQKAELSRIRKLNKQLAKNIIDNLSQVKINGGKKRLPNIIHLTFTGIDNEMLMMSLDEAGFEVAVGSACAASNDKPSHVLQAIGLSEEQAQSSIRISMGRFTTPASVDNLASELQNSFKRLATTR